MPWCSVSPNLILQASQIPTTSQSASSSPYQDWLKAHSSPTTKQNFPTSCNLQPSLQFGFCPGSDTIQHVLRLWIHLKSNFSHKLGLALSLDVTSAWTKSCGKVLPNLSLPKLDYIKRNISENTWLTTLDLTAAF